MTRREDEVEKLIKEWNIKLPKHWETYTHEQKLEYIAHRRLVDTRGTTKHSEMKEQGFLSDYQLQRRRRREIQSNFGSLDEVPPKRGVFSRTYRKKD